MSFIAGIVSFGGQRLPESMRLELMSALPPSDAESRVYNGKNAVIVQLGLRGAVDVGFFEDAFGAAAIAGEPYFPADPAAGGRLAYRGAAELRHGSPATNAIMAGQSVGSWAAAVFDEKVGQLVLMSDRLGVRPLYWWSDGTNAVFSSTLGTLERLAFLNRDLDMQGLVELAALGYSLGDRTPYTGIKRMLAGEVVRLTNARCERSRYWDPAGIPEATNCDQHSQVTLDALKGAVKRRLGPAREAITFLSGGLDSRVVNQLLHDVGLRITSFNFSPLGSQDAYLARQYADAIQAEHHAVPIEASYGIRWAALLASALEEVQRRAGDRTHLRATAWSGDGGSVCGGWVYMTPSIVSAMRVGDVSAAVREHMNNHAARFSRADLTSEARTWIGTRVQDAIVSELARYPEAIDPARRFFLFLLENNQRRHLDMHFEEIMDHRQEMFTPFFDGGFLQCAVAVPVDEGVGHRFYDRWFRQLPLVARSVPWQTYPGHLPCPLEVPAELTYQWARPGRFRRSRFPDLSSWAALVMSPRFPSQILRRGTLALRVLMHALGIRDESASLRLASTFARYMERSIWKRSLW